MSAYFKLFSNQNYPILGKNVRTLNIGDSYPIPLDVRVYECGQVKLNVVVNIIVGLPRNINIDIFRDGKSIINGTQKFFYRDIGTISTNPITINFSFATVDTNAPTGEHTYSAVITNVGTPILVLNNYSLTAKCPYQKSIYCSQNYPPIGTVVFDILPNSSKEVTVNVPKGKYLLEANLNCISKDFTLTNFYIDILNNGKSVTNGPQTMLTYSKGSKGSGELEFNLEVLTNNEALSNNTIYTLQLINKSPVEVTSVDFLSFSADNSQYKSYTQLCPPTGTVVATIQPNRNYIICKGLNINSKRNEVKVSLNANFIAPYAAEIICYDIKRDGISITNGYQCFYKALDLTPPSGINIELNLTAFVTDKNVVGGFHEYSVSLLNFGTLPIDVDLYSFTLEY